MDQDSAHMVAASKVPMLKPGKYEIWRIRIETIISDLRSCLEAVAKRFEGMQLQESAKEILKEHMKNFTALSSDMLIKLLHRLIMLVCQSQNSPQLVHEDLCNKSIQMDMDEMDLRMAIGHVGYEWKRSVSFKKSRQPEHGKLKKGVPYRTSTSTALVSCDGLGGYDWSNQAEEMA
ncbi:hypothetical protein Tco_1045317 [Tanacetum coccineum]|uniref:Uncharacterized protein n=1 Tax=Tanacetum coccineum TaxID=301880 RepID=A0ABQ5GUL1_9ASTR